MKKLLVFFFFLPTLLFCDSSLASNTFEKNSKEQETGYTINYNNVSIVEYIRFVSKITGVNFLYDEQELNFPVSVISEEPVTPENVMGTLNQILRIQGYFLLQEENNLVIHKNPNVKQLAHLAFDPEDIDGKYPFTTLVFRPKNESAKALADIVKPMLSVGAEIEVLNQTDQIILTDVTPNVASLSKLFEHLDLNKRSMTTEVYQVKNGDPDFLIATTEEILTPIAAQTPFTLTNPKGSSKIYIVSNPMVIEKALGILRNLDKDSGGKQTLKPGDVLIYKTQFRSANELLSSISQIAKNIEKNGYQKKGILSVLHNAKEIDQGSAILFTGNSLYLQKIQELMALLDTPDSKKSLKGKEVYLYPVKNRPLPEILSSLQKIADKMKQEGYLEEGLLEAIQDAKPIKESNSILFTASPQILQQISAIVSGLDVPTKKTMLSEKNSFFLYKPTHASVAKVYKSFEEIFQHLGKNPSANKELLSLKNRIGVAKTAGALVFTGDAALFPKVREMLSLIDTPSSKDKEGQFLAYKPQYLAGKKIFVAMQEYEKKLKASGFSDPNVLDAIASMKEVPSNGTLLFTGTPSALQQVSGLLETIDAPETALGSKSTFFFYRLKNIAKNRFQEYFQNIAKKLEKEGVKEQDLLQSIQSMKWIQQSHSFMFTGTEAALKKVEQMAEDLDSAALEAGQRSFILYPVKNVSRKMIEKYLNQIASNLDQSNKKQDYLYKAIQSMKWIGHSGSFMFSGTQSALTMIESLLHEYDAPPSTSGDTYFLYKLKFVKGDAIEKELEKFVQNMKEAPARASALIEVIENMKWIKETNSLLLTGPSIGVDEVKNLIAQYDVRTKRSSGEIHSDFYMYKPQHLSPDQLQLSLTDIAKNLESGGLVDEGLLSAIQSMKYSAQTGSLVFTGNPKALQKISAIIEEIDVPGSKEAAIQRIGKTTFLLYKLKNASGRQITQSIQKVVEDLKKSKTYDKELVKTLQNMKYIRETNSLLFTGPEEALEKAKDFVMKFDVVSLGEEKAPSQFFVYKPEFVSGPKLEKLLIEFADHLKETGLSDPELYNSLYSMKFIPNTKSLIFTGSETSLEKTKELLRTFDVPSSDFSSATSEIQPIDNTSFLVYKLQYHKGSEIQDALKRIGKDLEKSKAGVSGGLLDAISSIQWLEITNSLLVTGDQETLTRLKELIKNLDVPLTQVFIEVLAIQTTLTNMLEFGLDWGAKGNYRNRFAYSTSNLNNAPTTGSFGANLEGVNGTTTPTASDIPFGKGFDFGVIGDVILHKGKSFFSLGSLLKALQTDAETTVLLTPKIIAQDNKTSTLFVGQNIPFTGSVIQNFSTTATTYQNTNIEYRDIGLNLTITPVIGNSDIVSLDINIQNSVDPTDPSGERVTNLSPGTITGITTSKTSLETTVHVPNESFLILSGLVNNSSVRNKTSVPCLGGIPFIGSAFSVFSNTRNINNIVFFIRPRILHSRQDMKAVTEDQEDLFREKTGSAHLENQFDEAMENIKSIDDD